VRRRAIAYLNRPTKRRYPRYKFESGIGISVIRGETPQMVKGFCEVLGEGGAGLRTDEKLRVHEILYVQIPFPGRQLRLPAAVRNQRGHEYGVEFLALDKPDREFLRNTCSAYPKVG